MEQRSATYSPARAHVRGVAGVILCCLVVGAMFSPPGARAEDIAVGSAVAVTGTGGDGLNVRSTPATNGAVIGVEAEGAQGNVLEGPIAADGYSWWRVQWTDGLAGWSVSRYLAVVPPSPVPGAPVNLQAVAATESIMLTWSAPQQSGNTPITAWRIYRDQHSRPTTLVATLSSGEPGYAEKTWTDGPMLIGGRQYWYAVSAVNADGEGIRSGEATATPQAAPLPEGVFFLPPQLNFGGEQNSLALTLQNTGATPVTFSVVAGAPWLVGVSPVDGTIPVGGMQQVSVSVQRSGIPAGMYESLLRVTCQAGGINIPVQMRVGMIQGIDVSRWQCSGRDPMNPIDWTAVRTAGYRFVYVKATEGVSITDAFLHTLAPGARSAGLLTGVYHICWPAENTAAAEAAFFLREAGRYVTSGFLVPVLDIEPRYNIGGAAMVRWVDEWSAIVRSATGANPILYCSTSVAAGLLKADPSIAGRYRLWIAAYTSGSQPNTGGWDSWSFWQHADNGTVPGIEDHNVDLDRFNGSEESLAQYVIGGVTNTMYNLVSAVMGNGLLGIEPQSASFLSGSTVTLTAKPVDGWTFIGWSGSVTGTTNPLALTMDGDKAVLATFERLGHVVTLTVGSTTVTVDGQSMTLDTAPVIVGGRTLVPLRAIIEGLGGMITWVAETRSVEVVLGDRVLLLQIGNRIAVVNGEPVVMDVPAAIIGGRTVLPVRFVAENLGAEVAWEAVTRTITVTLAHVRAGETPLSR